MKYTFWKYQNQWKELEMLLSRARGDRALSGLSAEELIRLDVLYRQTAVHLAQVRTRTRDVQLMRYLNDLTSRAHSVVYVPPGKIRNFSLAGFFATVFPSAVARTWKFHLASLLLFAAGFFYAYRVSLESDLAAYAIMPHGLTAGRTMGAPREFLLDSLRHGRDMESGEKFAFAAFLFQHNTNIGMLSLATGILAAIPTVFLIIYNGMVLGAFTSVFHSKDIVLEYWAWILPHGVTEILALVLCGGIGLALGSAVIDPGFRPRAESVKSAGREAARMLPGVALMLVIAAVIESYLRQSHLSSDIRLAFAGASAVAWAAYFATGLIREATKRKASPEKPA